ncbi:M48 family metallopeptidase [Singulisphaera rosea]
MKLSLPVLALILCAAGSLGADAPETNVRPDPPSLKRQADELVPVDVPEATPLALRFYRSGNWLWAFGQAWSLSIPTVLLLTGISAKLRDVARRLGRVWFLTFPIYLVLYLALDFAIDFPLHYYRGYVRLHEYGLSNQTFAKWLGDSLKGLGISVVGGCLFAWVPFALLARRPKRWWLDTSLLTVPFLFFVVLVHPLWIDPLFNEFGPMKNQALEHEILALAKRAGIDGSRVFEVEKSVDTKAMNAYVTGFLGSKRVVLWDTLLAKLNDKEVLGVMGHEMGHYVLGHIPRSILLSFFVTLASLFFVDRAGRWLVSKYSGRFGFDRLSDVASIPLLLLLLHVSTLVLGPVTNMYSQAQEHEADQFGLEVTRLNRSTALAFAKLQRENLANPRPGLLFKLWRSTHPSIADRIEFCNRYHPWTTGEPLRFSNWLTP